MRKSAAEVVNGRIFNRYKRVLESVEAKTYYKHILRYVHVCPFVYLLVFFFTVGYVHALEHVMWQLWQLL